MTTPATPCAACGCDNAHVDDLHAIAEAVATDELDRAIDLGLLDAQPCAHCDAGCRVRVIGARDARRSALAARERYRARSERLQRRDQARAERRERAASQPAALPPAAAAALARARARAAKP